MTDRPNYTNEHMEAVCEALEDFKLSDFQIANLAADLPREYRGHMEDKAERDWEAAYDPESMAQRDETYRRDMIAAGRGELLK